MRQLLPEPVADVDPAALYAGDPRPSPPGRPWVLLGMIASADGAAVVDGRSGPLGGPGDHAVFRAVRGVADVVLVGAGTVRAEGYGPIRHADAVHAARIARGQGAGRIAVVSASLDLDWHGPLFSGAGARPWVLTVADADPDRRAEAEQVADVVAAGTGRVDLAAALAGLRADGVGIVLCEGGPSLNGQLLDLDLFDELCLTVSPALAGGDGSRITSGPALDGLQTLHLDRVLEDEGMLFLRYVRSSV